MLAAGKKCWARSMKKWLLQNQPQEVASFLPLVQLSLETTPQLATTRALQVKTVQPSLGTALGTTHIHPTPLAGVKGWAKSCVFWQNAHNIRVGVWMAKLATLQLMQSIGPKSTTGGPINQEIGAPPPLGFPYTMLNVKRVKYNVAGFHWKVFYQQQDRD